MNMFEKIYFTISIVIGLMFVIGSLFTFLSDGKIWLPILIYPMAAFTILTVLYFIVYMMFQMWGIDIPFFEKEILKQI